MGEEPIGMEPAQPARAGIDDDGTISPAAAGQRIDDGLVSPGGATAGVGTDGTVTAGVGIAPLLPWLWWPARALPPAPQASLPSPQPWLLLVDRRDPRVQAASADLEPLLQPEERARRDRFRLADDRHRALLGRGVLRLVLGGWLERDPASLVFQLGPHGKPALVGAGSAAPHFNLAHSGELILLAFHATCPVGVDVEQHRPDLAWEPLARRVLPPLECQLLERLPPEQRRQAFLAAWCRLEARLKARGEGLAGLERLHAEALAGQDPAGEVTWEVAVPAGYGAAAAVVAPV